MWSWKGIQLLSDMLDEETKTGNSLLARGYEIRGCKSNL